MRHIGASHASREIDGAENDESEQEYVLERSPHRHGARPLIEQGQHEAEIQERIEPKSDRRKGEAECRAIEVLEQGSTACGIDINAGAGPAAARDAGTTASAATTAAMTAGA